MDAKSSAVIVPLITSDAKIADSAHFATTSIQGRLYCRKNVHFWLVDDFVYEYFDREVVVVCLTPVHRLVESGLLKLDSSVNAQAPSLRRTAKLIVLC